MQKQFGRSMIEMLGVLAIVGVLSIVGIAMYRRAVNNHQANIILDDVNRFAFAIVESNRSFEKNTNITEDIEYTKTSPYVLEAFLGFKTEQFGIIVESIPKGVCEALLDKASVEYKVRVLPTDIATDDIAELPFIGTVYDAEHTDICAAENDVILHFGNTVGQCNPIANKECTSNADCCNGYFCIFENTKWCNKQKGKCRETNFSESSMMPLSSGQIWAESEPMNWWSAQNWCEAIGMSTISREDVGCKGISNCTCYPSVDISYHYYWTNEDGTNDGSGCSGVFLNAIVNSRFCAGADGKGNARRALCH